MSFLRESWRLRLCTRLLKCDIAMFSDNSVGDEESNRYILHNDNSFDDVNNVPTLTSPTSAASYVVSETPTYQSIFANTLSTKQQQQSAANNNSSNVA
jgi:hypothetical protein